MFISNDINTCVMKTDLLLVSMVLLNAVMSQCVVDIIWLWLAKPALNKLHIPGNTKLGQKKVFHTKV